MKRIFFLLILQSLIFNSFAQDSTSTAPTTKVEDSNPPVYPYVLPIWGQKAAEKGFADKLQLPFGVSLNYIYAGVDMKITKFELFLGDRDLTDIINTETLNFTSVFAYSHGINLRADTWILPFLNVYGMVTKFYGGTDVSLQPTWRDDETGEIILQLPEFGSQVSFDGVGGGFGATAIYGFRNYFINADFNYTAAKTALLDDPVGIHTFSARVGRRFGLSKKNKDLFIAGYIGAMYRNFVTKGSRGSVGLDEVFPDANANFNENVDNKIQENEDKINDPATGIVEREILKKKNEALAEIKQGVNESGIFTRKIEYFIFKEMIQKWTFQFGFNLQLSKNWMFRGEYGVSDSQKFLVTGIQYRFGVKKKNLIVRE